MNDLDDAKPSYLELWLILSTGLLHVTIELAWGRPSGGMATAGLPEVIYNIVVAALWSCYVLWRVMKTPRLAYMWGFRRDNFYQALRPSLLFALLAATVLLPYGHVEGRLPFPATFWLVLLLYPLYGIAQQFALQVLVTKNLRELVTSRSLRVVVVASIFSMAHFPNYRLMSLVFPAGLAFTWIYEPHPNLWAVGIVHGVVGAMAYYLVLGLDPGAELLNAIVRLAS